MIDQEIIDDWTKSVKDISFYAEKYCKVFDLTRGGHHPFKMFPIQQGLLNHYKENRFTLVKKTRQMGVSTITALYCAHKLLFASPKKREQILLICNRLECGVEFLHKIKDLIESAPEYLTPRDRDGRVKYLRCTKTEIELPNGSQFKVTAATVDAVRGYCPTLVVFEEAAFIKNGDMIWWSVLPCLSTGGSAIVLSTPNGFDPFFFALYNGMVKGENDFKCYVMNWYTDPRFNKDLSWVKKDAETLFNKNEDSFHDLIASGYKPTSSWYKEMCRQYNNDKRKIAMEIDCEFYVED